MSPIRPTVLCAAGILAGFAAGWFLKPARVPVTAGQGVDGAGRKTALPTSLAGRPVGAAGETWLDAAAADAAAVRGAARAGGVNQVLVEKLKSVLAMPDPAERQARWSGLLSLMRLEDAGGVRAMLREAMSEGRGLHEEGTAFWRRCGRMDPAAALAWAEEDGGEGTPDVLGGWACRDSAAAIAWLRDHPGDSDYGTVRDLAGLVKGLAAQSPEAAVGLLITHGDEPRFRPCLGMAADFVTGHRGVSAIPQWFSGMAESDAPDAFKTANLERLLSRRAKGNAAQRMELARTAARYAGEPWFSPSAAGDLGEFMGQAGPAAGAEAMERFVDGEAKRYFMDPFLKGWLTRDREGKSLAEWLESNRSSPSFDSVAFQLALHLSKRDMGAARGWAVRIADPAQREWLMKEVLSGQGN